MLLERALRIPARQEVVFAEDAVLGVGGLVRALGHDSAFVVTDRDLMAAGVAPRLLRALADDGVRTGHFDGVARNPDLACVLEGSLALRAFGPAVVVAIGGGSPMDAAKAIALHAANDVGVEALDREPGDLQPAAPLIAVPTTAGTGAETNGFGVIDDPAAQRKRYVGHPSTSPRYAVLDPSLTLSAPAGVTAACGIDVLAHAVESVQARAGNEYSAALASEAVRIVAAHLPGLVADGTDRAARASMLLAAHLAGLAFATTGLGTAHAIGHALSARYGTAHGVALAVVLPEVVALNLEAREAATARLAAATQIAPDAGGVPAAVAALRDRAGLPARLRDLRVPREDLPALAAGAVRDVVIANAPGAPTETAVLRLLETAY